MRKNLSTFACAAGAVLFSAAYAQADSILFTRAMQSPPPRSQASRVEARFSDAGRGGFSLGLSDLSVEAATIAGNDAMLTGLSWGPTTSASVRAISAVLAAGSRLGSTGGGGAAGGGSGGAEKVASSRYTFGSPASTWRDFVTGQLNNPAVGPQTRPPSFAGSEGGPFASLPPGLLDPGRPANQVPDRIRDRLETLLAGLRRPERPTRPGRGEPPLPLPGRPGGPSVTPEPPGEIIPNPEPSSLALMGIGLASVAGVTWRRRRRHLAE